MKTYLVTVIVEVDEEEYKEWSEGSEETFSICNKVNAQENGVHVLSYKQVRNNAFPKWEVMTEEGGI